jgi:hypothetical protein
LASRLTAQPEEKDVERIQRAFLLLYGRPVTDNELQLGLAYLHAKRAPSSADDRNRLTRWEQYAQVLLSANEFLYVD